MGFFNDVVKVISAPVTVPAKVFSNVVKSVDSSSPLAQSVSKIAASPYDLTKKGVSGASISEFIQTNKPVISALGGAATAGGTSLLGFDASSISKLTDVFGNTSGGKVNPVPGGQTYETAAAATPFKTEDSSSTDMLPIFIIGAAGALAFFLFKGKK